MVLFFVAVFLLAALFGVPSIQLSLRRKVTKFTDTEVISRRISSDEIVFWNPFSGVQVFKEGELAYGRPIFAMMPLKYCVDFSPIKNPVTVFIFGEELFSECTE